jgi:hypothetical protein
MAARLVASIGCLATIAVIALIAAIVGSLGRLTSLLPGNDSWRHYAAGGMYVTDAPSFSPDERLIAFSSPATGHGDIYVLDVKTSQVQQVTESPLCDLSPRFFGPRQIVFQREEPPYCHVWTIDLDTRVERQITHGRVAENIFDVSPDGDRILIWRTNYWSEGNLYLLTLSTGQSKKLPLSSYALFINNGTSVGGGVDKDVEASALLSLGDGNKQRLCAGLVADCNDNAKAILLNGARRDGPNTDIACLQLGEPEPLDVGVGHSAKVFSNGKILFFSGFEHQAWIWDPMTKTARQIDSPSGYKYRPNLNAAGNVAVLFVKHPDPSTTVSDRELHIFLFDANTEAFTEVKVTPPVK